ncbi:NAD-dependent protein deacylase [Lachnellula subtilissima]|uniref:NAD-dependent protein deacylase n=1 Tax=Lachnellula subtilissima TaxID=602034 RepID=A0A8H8UCM2_9HELO|nr:NAD-dependent protein deacylase [Lachnellula subtilissima]
MPSSRHQKSLLVTTPTPSTETPIFASEAEINSFGKYLHSSKLILVFCGAGLSAASGIPTCSGDDCFEKLPGLVWKYHAERGKLALGAKQNRAHEALAVLAGKKNGVRVLTQNIDGLSQKAKHPKDRLYELHGSLMDVKCSNTECDYYEKDNFTEPICPALAVENAIEAFAPTATQSLNDKASTEEIASKLAQLTVKRAKKENEKESKPAPTFEPRALWQTLSPLYHLADEIGQN